MAIREAQVANAVSFLSHPNVQGTPLEERIEFLKGKGLTKEEIDEAISQANVATGDLTQVSEPQNGSQVNPVYAAAPVPPVVQAPPQQPWWVRALIPANLALFAGAGMVYLYRNLVLHERPHPLLGRMQQLMNGEPGAMSQQNPNMSPPPVQGGKSDSNQAHGPNDLPLNAASMYGTAPYAQNNSTSANPGANMNGALVPSTSRSNDLVPSPGSNSEKVAEKVVEKQIECLNIACEALKATLEELKDLKAEKVARGGQPSSNTDSALLQTLIAMQANQSSQLELKSDIAAIKELLASKLGMAAGELDSSKLSAPSDKATPPDNTQPKSVMDTLLKAASAPPSRTRTGSQGSRSTADEASAADSNKQQELSSDETEKRVHIEASREALAKMCKGAKDSNTLVQAANMLLMYLKNLVNDTDNPRYRRIAKTNSKFKKLLEPVEGHLEFLKAIGFAEKSGGVPGLSSTSALEWQSKWLENKDGWAKEVLRDAVSNLESVKIQHAPGVPGRVDSASEETKESSGGSIKLSATNGTTAWKSFGGASSQTQSSGTTSEGTAGTTAEPEYPPDFAEVMKMQQQGIRPPGIKDIPSHLSTEAEQWRSAMSKSSAPSKPWEKSNPVPEEPTSFAELLKTTSNGTSQPTAQVKEETVNKMSAAESSDVVQEVSS